MNVHTQKVPTRKHTGCKVSGTLPKVNSIHINNNLKDPISMKKLMTILAVGSLSLTSLMAIGKFVTSVQTASTVSGLEAKAEVDKAVLATAAVSLVIPNYSHCKMQIPEMRNIEQVAPKEGRRRVFDSDGLEIGYVTPESVLFITKPCNDSEPNTEG